MKAFKWGCLYLPGLIVVVAFAGIAISGWHFRLDSTQRDILAQYVPEAQCDDADFSVESAYRITAYIYEVRISGSQTCFASLQEALQGRTFPNSNGAGRVLKGYDSSVDGGEMVTFRFEPLTEEVIWVRQRDD